MPNAYSRAAKAQDDSNSIRLQKLLAQAGFGSRRKCEDMITEGRVEVDGELVTELGTRVDPHKQQVRVDGSRVRVNPNHVTLALNKPRKVLSAMGRPEGPLHAARHRGRQVRAHLPHGPSRLRFRGSYPHDERRRALAARHATPSTRSRRPTSLRWKARSPAPCAVDS